MSTAPSRRAGGIGLVTLVWLAAFLFSLSTLRFPNDHFGRISPARQIARYGELPFRDYFDPGYFLTELASAALLYMFGDNLLGEALMNASFIAAGAALIAIVCRDLSGSYVVAAVAAVLAVLTMPRSYDYDKFLFYPLGVYLCWRYASRPTPSAAVLLAMGIVVAGLFRYDNGIVIGCAALVTLGVLHARERGLLALRLGLLASSIALAATPALWFLHQRGGVGDAAHQALTYARREGMRTRLEAPPPLTAMRLVTWAPPAPPVIDVRWAAPTDDDARRGAEARYQLTAGRRHAPPNDMTWSYAIRDASPQNIVGLLTDARTGETRGIDRATFRLTPPSLWTRLRRALPVLRTRILPDGWPPGNAIAFLYYLFAVPPIIVAAIVLRTAYAGPRPDAILTTERRDRALVLGLAALCLLVAGFILRDPLPARIGGAAGPIVVLLAWVSHRLWTRPGTRWLSRAAVGVVMCGVVASLNSVGEWNGAFSRASANMPRLRAELSVLAASPPSLTMLPTQDIRELVTYVRECTRPEDRIFASWFVPDLYFFAQRGFAARMVVTFGAHWSELQSQRRIVDEWDAAATAMVIHDTTEMPGFQKTYPLVDEYIRTHYRALGETTFGSAAPNARSFTVLVARSRVPVRSSPRWPIPCFA